MLRGMFSFAIYDLETNDTFIARDHFGIKPLYYLKNDELEDPLISKEHIYANVFTFDQTGLINGVDSSQFLAQKPGKINAVKSLNLNGTVISIGDGWTDYQIKESGLAHYFIAYTESVTRKPVIKNGDTVATSFHDVLDFLNSIKK